MPRQNRVNPYSELRAVPARGALTGNRGCLHDERGQIRRLFAGQRWIICLLEFKGRRRSIMTPGHYTELFFLDEATALAAGHRPCAECQRDRFNLFRELWVKAVPEAGSSRQESAAAIDARLHKERLIGINNFASLPTVTDIDACLTLPDGTFVSDEARCAYMVYRSELLRWSFDGYDRAEPAEVTFPMKILTPASIVRLLGAGYPVMMQL